MRSMGQRKSDPGSLAFSRGPVQGVHSQQGFEGGGPGGGRGAKRATEGGKGSGRGYLMGIDEDTREFRTRPHPSTLSIGLSQLCAPSPILR